MTRRVYPKDPIPELQYEDNKPRKYGDLELDKKTGKPKEWESKFTKDTMRQMAALCRMKPSREDVAAFFEVHPETIDYWVKKTQGIKFTEFRERHVVKCRYDLVREALRRAQQSDSLLVFALKNIAKWSDKQEIDLHADLRPSIIRRRDGSQEVLGYEKQKDEVIEVESENNS